VSKIFEALNEAGKERMKNEPPKVSWRTKVGPPQMAVDNHIPSSSAEEYDRLRQQIKIFFPGNAPKVLMFVSPSEAEDSAKVVVSFGYTVAWIGESVILVDGNTQNSGLHRVLGTDQGPGLSELLSGNVTANEAIRETGVNKLRLVPGGAQAVNSLFDSENAVLIDSLNALRTSADWIIFNAPPVSSAQGLTALSRVVDGVVFVIRAEKTRWEAALNAKEQLKKAGANIIGAVLTGRMNRIPAWLNRWL
jgi:capsular exopolysaccharide synthesis family protein